MIKTVSALLLLGASSSFASFMVVGLPDSPSAGAVPAGMIYGSIFNVPSGSSFLFSSYALYDAGTAGFGSDQNVGLYKSNGSNYVRLEYVTLNAAVPTLTVDGRTFATTPASVNILEPGSYFLGYSSATPAQYLVPQTAAVGGGVNQIQTADLNFIFNGAGSVGGDVASVTSFSVGSITTGNAANINVFGDLVAVPEVGSVLMGTLLTMMGVAYRRRPIAA